MRTETTRRAGRQTAWVRTTRPALAAALAAALALSTLSAGPARAATYPDTSLFGTSLPSSRVNTQAAWYRACMRAKDAAPPATDVRASPATPCDAQLSYYDTVDRADAGNADWTRVRACALGTRDTAVLMMVYANGLGVQTDPVLALHYACSTPAAPLELERRINHLTRLAQEEAPRFDQCDDATSRLTINTCAAIAQRRNEHAAQARLEKLTVNWRAPEKAALGNLRMALAGFSDARGWHEADLMRTLGPAFAPAAERMRAAEIDVFLDDLERFERGRLPSYTAAQDAGFSNQLGLAYRKLTSGRYGMASGMAADIATSVAQTEQAWTRYRNAWVAFGHVRYPSVPAHAWEALLAKRRIEELRHLARELSSKH